MHLMLRFGFRSVVRPGRFKFTCTIFACRQTLLVIISCLEHSLPSAHPCVSCAQPPVHGIWDVGWAGACGAVHHAPPHGNPLQVATPEFKVYAKRVKANARALGAAFMEKGYKLMSNGVRVCQVGSCHTGHSSHLSPPTATHPHVAVLFFLPRQCSVYIHILYCIYNTFA